MKLGSSHVLNGALCALLVGSVAAACGSDSQHRTVRAAGGGGVGAEGGVAPATQAGGVGTKPQPLGGNGGEPVQPVELGGAGGVPAEVVAAGQGGTPLVAMGGVPGGGEGGVPADVLPPVNCDPVTIVDANLEATIRALLKKASGAINSTDAVKLKTLDAHMANGIANLSGIECFTELTSVDFGIGGATSSITDLTPLLYLQKLISVDLSGDPLKTLEPLEKLPDLQDLSLYFAPNALNLAPLATAPSLTTLDLRRTTVSTVAPLGAITTLKQVDLSQATLTKPATLSALTNVSDLLLDGVITDATPLAALKQLKILDISNKPITNFGKLSTLVNLTSLTAQNAQLTDMTAVGSMTKLTALDVYGNNIADPSPLTTVTKLTDLNLGNNQVTSIAALQGLTLLKNLSLFNNTITSITPLVNNAGIGAGDTVDVSGNTVSCTDVTTLRNRGATVYDGACP